MTAPNLFANYVCLHEVDRLPRVPAVYLVEDDDGTVIYVGQSRNIHKRWIAHHVIARLTQYRDCRVYWQPYEVADLKAMESHWIAECSPKLNRGRKRLEKPFGSKWCWCSDDGLTEMGRQLTRGSDFKVMYSLMARLDEGNEFQVSQDSIARELGIRQPDASRSMRRLMKTSLIRLVSRVHGKGSRYMMNPEYFWYGEDMTHHQAALDTWSRLAA